MLKGHCLCGAIPVRDGRAADARMRLPLLHVPPCGELAGDGRVWFTVPRGAYRVVARHARELPLVRRTRIRTFCGTCGTPLTFRSTRHPDEDR